MKGLTNLTWRFGDRDGRRHTHRFLALMMVMAALAPVGQRPAAAQDLTLEPGFVALFDGTAASFAAWQVAGVEGFALEDGVIVAGASEEEDLGLLYYAARPFSNFVLRLQVRITAPDANSGVYVRFRDPRLPLPEALLAAPGAETTFLNRLYYGDNPAYSAIDTGFEAQIDDLAAGDPFITTDDGQDQHRTGAFYDVPIGTDAGQQAYQPGTALAVDQWHDLEIEVVGDSAIIRLHGVQTSAFTNVNPLRGLAADVDGDSGFIGVQSHPFSDGHVEFRHIRIMELPAMALEARRVSGGAPSPAMTPAIEPLFAATIPDGFDREDVTLSVSRLAYGPGEGDAWVSFDGPSVFIVRSESLHVLDNRAITVLRQSPAATEETPSAAAVELALAPGDGVVAPQFAPVSLRNAGPTAAEGMAITILASDRGNPGRVFADMSDLWPLLGKGELPAFSTPADVRLDRVELAPGQTLTRTTAAGVDLVHLETGQVLTMVQRGLAEASSGAFLRTGAIGPGMTFLGPGQERRLRDEAGLLVKPHSSVVLHNESDEPVRLLLLRIAPSRGDGG